MKKQKNLKLLLLVGIVAVMAMGTANAAIGDKYVSTTGVDSNEGNAWDTAYLTIQRGLDTVADAGTVNIAPGTYSGTGNTKLDVKTSEVTIKGSGQDTTILDGTSVLGSLLPVESSEKVTLQDLTIQNSISGISPIPNSGELTVKNVKFKDNTAYPSGSGFGGAIANDGTLTVTNSNFESNHAEKGGAIYNTGTLTVTGSKFRSNTATNGGGAISMDGTATIKDSTFEKNTATSNIASGGAIEVNDQGTLTVTRSKFIDNTAQFFGGAIDTVTSRTTLIITESLFKSNNAPVAGAISSIGTIKISGSTFDHNSASEGGGALITGAGPSTISKSTFSSNSAPRDAAISTNGNLIITGSNFYNNQASISGGAIGVSSGDTQNAGDMIIKYSRFVGNTAGTTPQDIYLHYQSAASPTINLDATLNWWGSNTGPEPGRINADEGRVPSSDSYTPWLILSIKTNPTSINVGKSSIINADLYTDSAGGNHQADAALYPTSIPIKFTTNRGRLNNNGQTLNTYLKSGSATVTLKAGSIPGTAKTTAQVDKQTVTSKITIKPSYQPKPPCHYKSSCHHYRPRCHC